MENTDQTKEPKAKPKAKASGRKVQSKKEQDMGGKGCENMNKATASICF